MILDRTPEKDKAGPADFCPATDLQHAEAALRASEEKYRTILEDIDEGYFEIDLKGNFTFVNDVLCRDLGYPRRELIGMNYRQYMENSMARMSQTVFAELYAAGQASGRYEGEFIEKSGAKHFCEVSVSLLRDVRGRPIGFRGLSRNITKRKRSEEALRHNEYFLRKSQEVARLGSFDFHVKTGLWISSPTLDTLLGIGKDYIKNVRGWFGLIHPDDREELKSDLEQGLARKLPLVEKEFRVLRNSDGRELWVRYRGEATFDQNGAPERLIGTIQDITEHRLMQKKLIESEQKYRSIVENAQEGIFHAAPRERPLSANAAFAALLGYDSPEDLARSVASIAGQIYVHPDEYHAVLKKVREEGGVKDYETQFYRKDQSRIWIRMSVSAVRDAQGRLVSYHGFVEDITPWKKLEQERQDNINSLRKSLGATIRAMSATIEARDPYTAGHQRRVADLARAVATEMNLSRDQIDGIRLAGMIHDVGKISVPSEILTKPTTLTALEMKMIRLHAEAGYNILKSIDFPWPIARMVREHHERIDGSGYPFGLPGKDILLESKILAIADVVEAISSHRPYRPSLGIGTALEEIERNAGVLYDETAARACLKIFRENRYRMPE